MHFDFKNIHIGSLIRQRINETQINPSRICRFLKCTNSELEEYLSREILDSETILRFSLLLEYDFFRLYSQYLILFSAKEKSDSNIIAGKTTLPTFRKNLYTIEIINFVLDLIDSGKKSKQQIIEEYKIPKTTLYKWISKYRNDFNKIK